MPLELTTTARVVDADADWPLTVTLTNRSARGQGHTVVEPGDGSEVGWRAPHVFYTAEVESAAGASLAVGDRFLAPSQMFELDKSTNVRLYAHYDYDGARGDFSFFRDQDGRASPMKDGATAERKRALMADLVAGGPFSLVSHAIELLVQVDPSIEMSLALRRSEGRANRPWTFDDLGDAYVVSHAASELDLGEDFPFERFQLDVRDAAGEVSSVPLQGPATLAPGARARLLVRLDSRWSDRRGEGTAITRRYRSAWTKLSLAP